MALYRSGIAHSRRKHAGHLQVMNDDQHTFEKARATSGGAVRWLHLAMVASVVLPLALLAATAAIDYVRVMNQARERVQKTASIAQEHALKVLETSEVIITRVLDLLDDDSDAQIKTREPSLHANLKRVAEEIEQVRNIYAWSRTGEPLVSSRYHPVPPVNVAGREDFAVHVHDRIGTHVTRQLIGRTTGERFFNVSRRRETAAGGFAGIVTVSLLPQYFTAFYKELSAPTNGMSISIWRNDGYLLARYPARSDPTARLPASTELMKFVATGRHFGEARGKASASGTERLYGFRKIGPYPLYVSVALDYPEVMAEWYRNLATSALFALPAVLALVFITWVALQKTRREQAAVEQWREEANRRASAEEALRQAQKLEAIGQLTGGVAHDFNNLLQVVSTNLYILKVKAKGCDVEQQLGAIARAVTSGETLTKHLLAFSRRRPLQPRVMQLQERMADIRTLLQHTLRGDVALHTNVEDSLWSIKIDPAELEMALINVAVNARDALPDGGSVTVTARNVRCDGSQRYASLRGDYVAIAVHDTGAGIPADILDRVFEPFFTTKEVGKGTGLGLSQVYGFAAQSEGSATIESELGRGTTVTLYLPRALEAPAAQAAAPETAEERVGTGHILLAEDNPEIGRAVSAVLEEMGYAVRHVPNAESALAALRSERPFDVLITDIIMPGSMNGLDLARTVRLRFPWLPVLLVSGYTAEADKAAAEGYRILSKPFRPEALAAAIRETLSSHNDEQLRASTT